jgi:hypothetical protein
MQAVLANMTSFQESLPSGLGLGEATTDNLGTLRLPGRAEASDPFREPVWDDQNPRQGSG